MKYFEWYKKYKWEILIAFTIICLSSIATVEIFNFFDKATYDPCNDCCDLALERTGKASLMCSYNDNLGMWEVSSSDSREYSGEQLDLLKDVTFNINEDLIKKVGE